MTITYNETDKKIVIENCVDDSGKPFESIELEYQGQIFADIPLTDGNGFITNQDTAIKGDEIVTYPYNKIVVTL